MKKSIFVFVNKMELSFTLKIAKYKAFGEKSLRPTQYVI